MKKLESTLLVLTIIFGLVKTTLVMAQKSSKPITEVEISTVSAESPAQVSTEQEQKRNRAMENMEREDEERKKQIREKLPKTIIDVRHWIKENKLFPPYQGLMFSDLARIDEGDPEIFKLYCEILDESIDTRAKLSALSAIRRTNNKSAIPVLKKATRDEGIFVSCEAANILFDWGEKEFVIPIYVKILTNEDLENQIDKELPEKLKHIGFHSDKSDPQWELYSIRAKSDMLVAVLQRILVYNKPEIGDMIKKIVKEQKVIPIIKKSVRLDSEELEKQKKEYPNWADFHTWEDFIKSKKELIEKLDKVTVEEKK